VVGREGGIRLGWRGNIAASLASRKLSGRSIAVAGQSSPAGGLSALSAADWADDRERRHKAGVPEVEFKPMGARTECGRPRVGWICHYQTTRAPIAALMGWSYPYTLGNGGKTKKLSERTGMESRCPTRHIGRKSRPWGAGGVRSSRVSFSRSPLPFRRVLPRTPRRLRSTGVGVAYPLKGVFYGYIGRTSNQISVELFPQRNLSNGFPP
jgi:hypothetical protein